MTIQTVGDITSFKWGSITAVNPLAVKLDGDSAALSLIPDSLVDPTTLWVGARVRVELSLRRVVIHGVNKGSDGFASGDIIATARSIARTGWLLCQGQSLLRTDYPSLFAAIGTTYGAADSTRFTLPDGRGRVLIGSGTASGAAGATAHPLGQVGGEETHVLSVAEMPSHQHNMKFVSGLGSSGYIPLGATGTLYNTPTELVGGGGAHNNMQPFVTGNLMIKI